MLTSELTVLQMQLVDFQWLAATYWPRRPCARRFNRKRRRNVLRWRGVATVSELAALAERVGGGERLAAR